MTKIKKQGNSTQQTSTNIDQSKQADSQTPHPVKIINMVTQTIQQKHKPITSQKLYYEIKQSKKQILEIQHNTYQPQNSRYGNRNYGLSRHWGRY